LTDSRTSENRRTWGDVARLIALAGVVCASLIAAFGLSEDGARRAWAGDDFTDGVPLHDHVNAWDLLDAKVDLARASDGVEVLAIGDSSCLAGFVPEVFEEETGLKALNLGTHGMAGMVGHMALLKEAYRSGCRARSVLLWIHPRTLRSSEADVATMGFSRWLDNRIHDTFDRGGFAARAHDTWGGLLRFRLLQKRLRRRDVTRPDESTLDVIVANRGWLPRREPGGSLEDSAVPSHRDSLGHVERIATFCSERDIALSIVVMPLVDGSSAGPEYLAATAAALKRAAPEAVQVDTTPDFLPRAWFADAGHVFESRAPALTRSVGRFYAEHGAR
jgi:hypothetical protein